MIKKLLMEGCGYMDTPGGKKLGNDRVRTALHNDKGVEIFICMKGHTITKFTTPKLKHYGDVVGIVEIAHYIAEDKGNISMLDDDRYFEWTKEGIKKLLKEQFNTTVNDIEISNDGYYNVFTTDGYNYGDREG